MNSSADPNGTTLSPCDNSLDYVDEISSYVFPDTHEWVFIALHAVVFVIGLVGNALVCLVVYKNYAMRTITNYYIVNLAVGDFLVLLLCLPPTIAWDVTETWFLGLTLCKLVMYFQNVSVTVSVLTLSFISVDRWYAICFPLKFKSTTKQAKLYIILIWVLALSLASPIVVVYKTGQHRIVEDCIKKKTIYLTDCFSDWSRNADNCYKYLNFGFLYLTPLALMTLAYYKIIKVLWSDPHIPGHTACSRRSRDSTGNVSQGSRSGEDFKLATRRKAAKMLVVVVFMFAVCNLPVHLIILLRDGMNNTILNQSLAIGSHFMCYANSAINPIVYNFMSCNFRKEFAKTFRLGRKFSRGQLDNQNSFPMWTGSNKNKTPRDQDVPVTKCETIRLAAIFHKHGESGKVDFL